MSTRVRIKPRDNNTLELTDPVSFDVFYDGQQYTMGPGQKMAIADDGVAAGFIAGETQLVEDNDASGIQYPNSAPSKA